MEAHAYGGLQKQKRSRGARRAPGVMSLTSAVNAPAKGKAASAPAKGATGNVAPVAKRTPPDLGAVLKKASATAFRGGLAGFAAGIVQARATRRDCAGVHYLTRPPLPLVARRSALSCGCAP